MEFEETKKLQVSLCIKNILYFIHIETVFDLLVKEEKEAKKRRSKC